MPTPEQNVEKLKELMKLLNESITREEFVSSFKNVVDLILKSEKSLAEKNDKALAQIEKLFNDLKRNLESSTNAELSRAVDEIKARAEKSLREQMAGMELIKDKVARIKEGRDGKNGERGDRGLQGEKGESFNHELIDELWKAIEELKKESKKERPMGMAVFGGNRPITIQGAGVTKTKTARAINFVGATVTEAQGLTTVTISATGGTNVDGEVPTNSGDSINFTIANTPTAGTFKLYRGGARQIGGGEDYTLTLTALVLTIALASGETLICDYSY